VSDQRDSLLNYGDAALAPRAGRGAELSVPDGETSEGAARDDKNNHDGMRGRVGPPEARETGGREGPDPTRFGDWEIKGRCIDF
jgi:hypothetical protein